MSISIIFSNLFIVRIDFLTLTPVLGVSSPNNGSGKAPFGDEYDGRGYDTNSHHHEGHDDVVIREFAVALVILVIASNGVLFNVAPVQHSFPQASLPNGAETVAKQWLQF